MTNPSTFFAIALSLIATVVIAEDNSFGKPLATLSFRMTEAGNISLPATLNGREHVDLMFHSAASAIHLTQECVKGLKTIEFQDAVESEAWGGTSESRVSKGNRIQFESLQEQSVVIFEDLHSGKGTDGKFGWDVFGDRVFEVDFEKQHIRLYDSIQPPASFARLEFKLDQGMMLVPAGVAISASDSESGRSFLEHEFLVHTGFTGTVLFDSEFAKQYLEGRMETRRTRELKDSFGNVIKVREVQIPGFRFGGSEMESLDIEYFDGKLGDRRLSVLGMKVIQQFHWIFDPKNQVAYVRHVRKI